MRLNFRKTPFPLVAAIVAVGVTVGGLLAPAAALSPDMGGLTPTLTYPDPTPQPVTRDADEISD